MRNRLRYLVVAVILAIVCVAAALSSSPKRARAQVPEWCNPWVFAWGTGWYRTCIFPIYNYPGISYCWILQYGDGRMYATLCY